MSDIQSGLSLYNDGRHYDLLMPGPNDLPFYRGQVNKYGEPVLELACGTGRLMVPLRVAGADIVGLDCSSAMLNVARGKAARSGVTIELLEGDVRDFSLDRTYRLIYIADNSLSHLLQREDIETCFRCVRRHLAPEGRFIVDIFTPSAHILARDPSQRFPVGEYGDPDDGRRIVVTETTKYDPATQVNHITWYYQKDGGESWDVPLKLRMFYPQEIDALLGYCGFTIERKYGDFDERPFGAESAKQLIVCK